MKITLSEFRDIVAAAVRTVVAEAKKKPREIAPRSEESILAQRDRAVKGLRGHTHMNPPGHSHADDSLDFTKPLGKKNLAKRQGASAMGNWTSESKRVEAIQRLVRMIVREEIQVTREGLFGFGSKGQIKWVKMTEGLRGMVNGQDRYLIRNLGRNAFRLEYIPPQDGHPAPQNIGGFQSENEAKTAAETHMSQNGSSGSAMTSSQQSKGTPFSTEGRRGR